MTKIKKDNPLRKLIDSQPKEDFKIIPFLDKYMMLKPNTGVYEVEDLYKPKDTYYHPSVDCDKCLRQIFYEKKNPIDEEYEPKSMRAFKFGHAIHSMVQAWIKDMSTLEGFPKSTYGSEVGFCDKVHNVKGSIDDIITFPYAPELDVPLELKTMNSAMFKELTSPKATHMEQVRIYLDNPKSERMADFAIILYMQKDYPHEMKEFIVKKTNVDYIYDRWNTVTEALMFDDEKMAPKKYHNCGSGCKYCQYKKECWK